MIDIFENSQAKMQTSISSDVPVLSVLIPYYKDDPAALLNALLASPLIGGDRLSVPIEILIYDDGTGDEAINSNLRRLVSDFDEALKDDIKRGDKNQTQIGVRLFFAKNNKGRSSARNALTGFARSDWVLFLDADMLPQTDQFLANYLSAIQLGDADILFGGFSVSDKKQSNATELHRVFSQTSDCLSAVDRQISGPQYVCSSNLCVRKSVLDKEAFDPNFFGWGWEDSEWAARVSKAHIIRHLENPALHLGLETTETLLSRFKESGSNYLRFTNAHPELARTLTLYKLSTKLRTIPAQKIMRPVLALMVRAGYLPPKIRLFALKLWRASWYAEALA